MRLRGPWGTSEVTLLKEPQKRVNEAYERKIEAWRMRALRHGRLLELARDKTMPWLVRKAAALCWWWL